MPKIANLLQKFGVERYSWFGNNLLNLVELVLKGKRPQYTDHVTGQWRAAQKKMREEWKPDPRSYRQQYEHFLRYYFRYTPQHAWQTWILDIGCGKWFYPLFGKYLGAHYTGIDPDPSTNEYINDEVWIKRAKGEEIPYPAGIFDVVLLLSTLDHVEDVNQVLSEVKRVLTKNGILWVTSVIHKENHIPTDYACAHLRSFTRNSLVQLLEAFFPTVTVVSKTGRFKGVKDVVYIMAEKKVNRKK